MVNNFFYNPIYKLVIGLLILVHNFIDLNKAISNPTYIHDIKLLKRVTLHEELYLVAFSKNF